MDERWKGIVVYVCIFLLTGFSIAYSNYVARASEQKHCAVVKVFNDALGESASNSQTVQLLKEGYRQLEIDLNCKR